MSPDATPTPPPHHDPVERLRVVDALPPDGRERRAAHTRASDAVLHATGIRALRRRPVFATPAFFAPLGFAAQHVPPAEDGAGSHPGAMAR